MKNLMIGSRIRPEIKKMLRQVSLIDLEKKFLRSALSRQKMPLMLI